MVKCGSHGSLTNPGEISRECGRPTVPTETQQGALVLGGGAPASKQRQAHGRAEARLQLAVLRGARCWATGRPLPGVSWTLAHSTHEVNSTRTRTRGDTRSTEHEGQRKLRDVSLSSKEQTNYENIEYFCIKNQVLTERKAAQRPGKYLQAVYMTD